MTEALQQKMGIENVVCSYLINKDQHKGTFEVLDATDFDENKVKEQAAFQNQTTGLIANEANWQRTGKAGKGRAFKSSALAKLFLLGAIKYATRDAYGMGVEYEGGRPGWNDAMNGLAG